MKKMKSLKGGLAGILIYSRITGSIVYFRSIIVGSNHREPPRLYTNQRKLCRKPLATETDEFH